MWWMLITQNDILMIRCRIFKGESLSPMVFDEYTSNGIRV